MTNIQRLKDYQKIQELSDLITVLEKEGCSCDVMYGYQCGIHEIARKGKPVFHNQTFDPGILLVGSSPGSEETTLEPLRIDYEGLDDSYFLNPETISEMVKEIRRGVTTYGDYRGWDQARFVIQDELHELWMEIRNHTRDLDKVRAEALQVAATAMRLVEEIDTGKLA